jgi:hypothetical protein
MKGYTTIQLTRETRDLLEKIGRKNESYEEVLKRILRALKAREEEKDFIEGMTLGLVKAEELE